MYSRPTLPFSKLGNVEKVGFWSTSQWIGAGCVTRTRDNHECGVTEWITCSRDQYHAVPGAGDVQGWPGRDHPHEPEEPHQCWARVVVC